MTAQPVWDDTPRWSDPPPMSEKRRRAIAAAAREDARRPFRVYAADPGRYENQCPHRLPGCRCDGLHHSPYGRAHQ